jgi:hypothetical protein
MAQIGHQETLDRGAELPQSGYSTPKRASTVSSAGWHYN